MFGCPDIKSNFSKYIYQSAVKLELMLTNLRDCVEKYQGVEACGCDDDEAAFATRLKCVWNVGNINLLRTTFPPL